jgi:hypothetical protein
MRNFAQTPLRRQPREGLRQLNTEKCRRSAAVVAEFDLRLGAGVDGSGLDKHAGHSPGFDLKSPKRHRLDLDRRETQPGVQENLFRDVNMVGGKAVLMTLIRRRVSAFDVPCI